jgi:hypothetical protein
LGIVTDSNGRSPWNGFFSIYGWNNGRFLPAKGWETAVFCCQLGLFGSRPDLPRVDQATSTINRRYLMSTGYIRSTHDEHGRFRPFPTAALTFWREQGEQIGRLLRPETPLTLAQLCQAYAEALDEHILTCPESGLLTMNSAAILCEMNIAWCLIQLLEHGLATAVATSPTPPLTGLLWQDMCPVALLAETAV